MILVNLAVQNQRAPKVVPELDPGFSPAALFHRDFDAAATAPGSTAVDIAVEQADHQRQHDGPDGGVALTGWHRRRGWRHGGRRRTRVKKMRHDSGVTRWTPFAALLAVVGLSAQLPDSTTDLVREPTINYFFRPTTDRVAALRKASRNVKILGRFGDAISNFGRGYCFVADYDRLFFKDHYIVDKLRAKLRSSTVTVHRSRTTPSRASWKSAGGSPGLPRWRPPTIR